MGVEEKSKGEKGPIRYYNLVKNPDIRVTDLGRNMHLRARLAAAEKKETHQSQGLLSR